MKALSFFLLCYVVIGVSCNRSSGSNHGWEVYGGSKNNDRYSTLRLVDTNNVSQLKVAWTYHTGDADSLSQIQANPLIIDGILYGVSPKLKLFALDAATGKEKWVFDPFAIKDSNAKGWYFIMNTCRGITYYTGGKNDKRLFFGASSNLYCVDAMTGKLVSTFDDKGKIENRKNRSQLYSFHQSVRFGGRRPQ